MNKFLAMMLKVVAAAGFTFAASTAAAGDVRWSVTVGNPYAGAYVYTPPPAVVYAPPHYVRPRPVYVQQAPVVTYGQPYYYVEAPRPRHHWKRDFHRHDHHHGRHHGRHHGGRHHGGHGRHHGH